MNFLIYAAYVLLILLAADRIVSILKIKNTPENKNRLFVIKIFFISILRGVDSIGVGLFGIFIFTVLPIPYTATMGKTGKILIGVIWHKNIGTLDICFLNCILRIIVPFMRKEIKENGV